MYLEITLTLFGGLGIFIYGITIMGDALKVAAGNKMRSLLEKVTNNPILGVLTGILVTAFLQSSSGATVMTISFINAGLLTLSQAVGIIIGANIGTTITAQLIAFKIPSYIFLTAIALGIFINLGLKDKEKQALGQMLLGFGFIFQGMDIMHLGVMPLEQNPSFIALMQVFSENHFLALLIGLIMTSIFQASGATIGILQTFSRQGIIPLEIGLPIVFGTNIGTCITPILASINANITAKRAAFIHLFFNVIGAIIFFILLKPTTLLITYVGGDIARQIANAHTLFNVATAIIILPCSALLVKFVKMVLPGKDEQQITGPRVLENTLLNNPHLALSIIEDELKRMANLVNISLHETPEALLHSDKQLIKKIQNRELDINDFKTSIVNFLVKLSTKSLNTKESTRITLFHNAVNIIEQIGDHCKSLSKLSQLLSNNRLKLSDNAISQLEQLKDSMIMNYNQVIKVFFEYDSHEAARLVNNEEHFNSLIDKYNSKQIHILSTKGLTDHSELLYFDILHHISRINDYTFLLLNNLIPVEKQS